MNVDVIVTTTCRPHLQRTFRSFLRRVRCTEPYRFIVNIDVLHPDYLPRTLAFLESLGITDVNINHEPGAFHEGHTRAINHLYSRITSPVFFHLQDDWIFRRNLDLDPLIRLMREHPHIDHIRLSKMTIPRREWLYHLSERPDEACMADHHQHEIDGIPLVHARTWSFNPSLARTRIARCFTDIPIGTRAETYICREYARRLDRDGCYIYGRIGDPAMVRDIGRARHKRVTKTVGKALRQVTAYAGLG